MNELINVNVITMSSLEIAKLTDKNHDNVLKDIRRILDEAEIGHVQFNGSYLTKQNKLSRCFNLPRRECDLIITGYSAKYRLAIIDRWQELEAIQDKPVMDELEMVIASAQHLMAVRKEQKEQALRLSELETSNKEVLARQNAIIEGLKFFTVLGYANLNNLQHLILKDAQTIGKRAAHLSRERNIPIDKVRDPRFGQVNAYAEVILNEIVAEYLG